MIFARYPNPKAGPEYLVELTNSLAEQPQWIVDRVADRHLGITAKHKSFAPSIGEVLDMIASLHDMEARSQRYEKAQTRRQPIRQRVTEPFRPFQKLWDAFADDRPTIEKLDLGLPFDTLFDASKALATRGKRSAFAIIWRGDQHPSEQSEAA